MRDLGWSGDLHAFCSLQEVARIGMSRKPKSSTQSVAYPDKQHGDETGIKKQEEKRRKAHSMSTCCTLARESFSECEWTTGSQEARDGGS